MRLVLIMCGTVNEMLERARGVYELPRSLFHFIYALG